MLFLVEVEQATVSRLHKKGAEHDTPSKQRFHALAKVLTPGDRTDDPDYGGSVLISNHWAGGIHETLHDELLRWFWCLWCLVGYLGGTDAHSILVITINGVIAFSLPLGRLNPIQADSRPLVELEI